MALFSATNFHLKPSLTFVKDAKFVLKPSLSSKDASLVFEVVFIPLKT